MCDAVAGSAMFDAFSDQQTVRSPAFSVITADPTPSGSPVTVAVSSWLIALLKVRPSEPVWLD
jgi:hypothetical protein